MKKTLIIHDAEGELDWYGMRDRHHEDAIGKAVAKINKHRESRGLHLVDYQKVTGSTPCSSCGSIDLIKTGTCHVCCVCGSSQGCS